MREILFRGKKTDNGQWVYGYPLIDTAPCSLKAARKCLCSHDGKPAFILQWNDALHEYEEIEVEPETVGQYTGEPDKNDVKIFEGDIVKCHDRLTGNDFIGVVDYADNSFRISDGAMTHYRWMDYECEVIGNIYDNPELLEANNG